MTRWSLVVLLLLMTLPLPVAALEFTAERITRIDGRVRTAVIYYRDDRWRVEHNATGPVSITIAREDKQLMWLLMPALRHFKTVPFDASQEPKVTEQLDGEIAREAIGSEVVDGHETTLYEVTTLEGPSHTKQVYYQWYAADIRFPLKLAKKDDHWVVEYRHVGIRPVSDALFQLPRHFRPVDAASSGRDRVAAK